MDLKYSIRERRLQLGLSQEELAFKAGYKSKSSIARIELGETDVNQAKLATIALALDTTPELLSGIRNGLIVRNKGYRNIVIIQAGGKSTRNTMNVPNQFINVDNKPIIVYIMEAYEKHPEIDEIYVSCLNGWESIVRSYAKRFGISKLKDIVSGGDTILISTKNALEGIPKIKEDDRIILQESTRPLISQDLISKLLSSFDKNGSSVMVKDMSDYVSLSIDNMGQAEYLPRSNVRVLESPEIYTYITISTVLKEAKYKGIKDENISISLLMLTFNRPLHYCESNANNIKIIRQEDIYIFKTLKTVIL